MSGGSKEQTVGYRYALGMHLALCHGPIDAIREILVDRRTAWSVLTGSGTGGGGAAVEVRVGSVAGMTASPALAGDPGATPLVSRDAGRHPHRAGLSPAPRRRHGPDRDPARRGLRCRHGPDPLDRAARGAELCRADRRGLRGHACRQQCGRGRRAHPHRQARPLRRREPRGRDRRRCRCADGRTGSGGERLSRRAHGRGGARLARALQSRAAAGLSREQPLPEALGRARDARADGRGRGPAMVSREGGHRPRGQHLGCRDLHRARCLGLDVRIPDGRAEGGRRGAAARDRRAVSIPTGRTTSASCSGTPASSAQSSGGTWGPQTMPPSRPGCWGFPTRPPAAPASTRPSRRREPSSRAADRSAGS